MDSKILKKVSKYVIKHILTLVYVVKLLYFCSEVIDFQGVLPILLNNRHYIYKRLIFKNYCVMELKNRVWSVFPADEKGNCLSGFCPTVCDDDELFDLCEDLIISLNRFRVKYSSIKAIEV